MYQHSDLQEGGGHLPTESVEPYPNNRISNQIPPVNIHDRASKLRNHIVDHDLQHLKCLLFKNQISNILEAIAYSFDSHKMEKF